MWLRWPDNEKRPGRRAHGAGWIMKGPTLMLRTSRPRPPERSDSTCPALRGPPLGEGPSFAPHDAMTSGLWVELHGKDTGRPGRRQTGHPIRGVDPVAASGAGTAQPAVADQHRIRPDQRPAGEAGQRPGPDAPRLPVPIRSGPAGRESCPLVGRRTPAISCRRVDLPAPLCPRSTTISSASMPTVTPESTQSARRPYRNDTSCRRMEHTMPQRPSGDDPLGPSPLDIDQRAASCEPTRPRWPRSGCG